jgi:ABC-type amino acid transport substrate-binding protein
MQGFRRASRRRVGTSRPVVAPPADIARRGALLHLFDSPPQEFLDEESTQRDRTSTSVLLGFDAIIGALQAGQCDAINSSLSYTEERDQVVDYALYGLFTDVIIVGGW